MDDEGSEGSDDEEQDALGSLLSRLFFRVLYASTSFPQMTSLTMKTFLKEGQVSYPAYHGTPFEKTMRNSRTFWSE